MNYGGADGLAPPNAAKAPFIRSQIPVVDFIGDSITTLGLPSGITPKLRTGPVSFTGKAWYAWASMQAKGGFLVGAVDGLSGMTSRDIAGYYANRMLADPSPIKAGYCLIHIGTNDAFVTHQTKEAIKRLSDLLISSGVEPILSTIAPRGSYQGERRSNWIRLYAQQNGLKCVDFATDPLITHNDSGNWLSGYSDDNVHPNDAGAKAMGTVLYNHFADWGILRNKVPMSMRNGDDMTLAYPSNALMMTDTNADGVPDGWTLTGAGATGALADAALGLGNELTITRASASTAVESTGRTVTAGALVSCAVRVQATMAGTTPSVTISAYKQNTTFLYEFTTTVDIPAGYILAGLVSIPGGLAAYAASMKAAITAGDGTVVKLSQPTIYDLTARGSFPL